MSGVLSAPPAVIIQPSAPNAPAEITYKSFLDIAIRERFNGAAWSRKKIPVHDNDTLLEGSYFVSIRPGDTYEAEAYKLDDIRTLNFPDETEGARLFGSVSVQGLKTRVTFPKTEPFQPEVGGTYWWARVATASPSAPTTPFPTWVRLQIGSNAPSTNKEGLREISGAPIDFVSAAKAVHELEAVPLLPGNEHFFVVTIANVSPGSSGEWEQVEGSFTTLLRGVSISLKTLVIRDTGETGGFAGPARFALYIRKANSVLEECLFNIDDITDDAPYDRIDLAKYYPCSHDIAPEPVAPGPEAVGIALRGVEEDFGFWDPDDVAETPSGQAVPLVFPTGRFKENFSNRTQTVRATERGNPERAFIFDVIVEYSVTYVPRV